MDSSMDCNRRDFMKYAGVGAAAMSFGGMLVSSNVSATTMAGIKTEEIETDVLVVGGGISATFAAVKAAKQGARVTLVDKGYVGRSGLTPWFHGFAYYDPDNKEGITPEDWQHGLMWATESISRKDYIDMFLEDSKARWDELSGWVGLKGDVQGKGPALRKAIVDSGADIVEGVMITELLEKDGKIVGAIGLSRDEDKTIIFKAGAVILCTGAGTFKSPGWPASPNTFDGQMMAYKLGVPFAGKEFNDFHGTSSVNPGDCFGNHGRPLAAPLQGETSPAAHSMRSLFWSASEAAPDGSEEQRHGPHGEEGGPPGGAPPGAEGGPPAGGGGPGGPGLQVLGAASGAAEHRMDGIFPSDSKCGAGIDGLYAAGDAMCTGGVGTAGSASPGCAVQGARAGVYAAEYAQKVKRGYLSQDEIAKVQNSIMEPRLREKGYSPKWITTALQNIMMPYYVLYVKRQDRLEAALTNVNFLKEHFVPRMIAKDSHELRLARETENMILNAEMKLRASLFRKESRHSHFREDFPFRDDNEWLSFVVIQKEGDQMGLKKWDIPQEWIPASLSKMSYEERYTDRYPGEAEYLKM